MQGDSIFMHVRNGEVLHRAKAGLHFFDCPFQFGNAPEHTTGTDTAEDADMASFDVQPNDILVVATDGIWDNMQDADILGLLPSSASGVDQVTYSNPDTPEPLFQLQLELSACRPLVSSAHHDCACLNTSMHFCRRDDWQLFCMQVSSPVSPNSSPGCGGLAIIQLSARTPEHGMHAEKQRK